jgi:PAS domain S-box-containing protein
LEALVDLSPDLMCLASVDGYLKRVNPAFERTLGSAAVEFVSRPMIDFVHPEDRERTRTALGVLAGGDELRQFETGAFVATVPFAGCSGTAGPD